MKIACISLGQHALKNILPAINRSKSSEIHGVYTRRSDVKDETSRFYGCKSYISEQEVWDDSEVELVYISSPLSEHYRQVKAALAAGKSVLIEKTAFSCYSEALELVALAQEKKLYIFEAFMYLYHPQFSFIEDLVQKRRLGRPLSCRISFGFPHLDDENIRYSQKLIGGALYDAGAYTVSCAVALFGQGLKINFSRMKREENYQVDTSGIALLEAEKCDISLEWGFGYSYKNKIEVWTDESIITVERAFSKPESYPAVISVEKNMVKETVFSERDNHFINMIEHINNVVSSEYTNIAMDNLKERHKIIDFIQAG